MKRELTTRIHRSVLALLALFIAFPLFAQKGSGASEQPESIACQTSLYYAKNQQDWFEKMNSSEISKLVTWVKENSEAQVKIEGWADQTGSKEVNDRVSTARARTAQQYLVKEGISADRITFVGMGIDYKSDEAQARRADMMAYLPTARPAEKKPAPAPEKKKPAPAPEKKKPAPAPTPTQEAAPATESAAPVQEATPATESTTVAPEESANPFTIRTNLAYWLGGLMNVGAEYKFEDSPVGIVLNAGYSPFSSESWKYNLGGWFVSPEVRYYLGSKEQWFIGAEFLYGGYDVKIPIVTTVGRAGNVIMGGLVGGYKITLSDTFDMDFTLGIGYASLDYKTYKVTGEGDRNVLMTDANYSGILPMQGGINLIWKLK